MIMVLNPAQERQIHGGTEASKPLNQGLSPHTLIVIGTIVLDQDQQGALSILLHQRIGSLLTEHCMRRR
jgi:hypothetical protein